MDVENRQPEIQLEVRRLHERANACLELAKNLSSRLISVTRVENEEKISGIGSTKVASQQTKHGAEIATAGELIEKTTDILSSIIGRLEI